MKSHGLSKKSNIFFALAAVASAALVLFSFVLTLAPTPAYANSAQKYFEGVDAAGAIMREYSPIVVENETLTFDIDEFPQNYYDDEEKFSTYGGKVTAEYTFFNPSEYTVTSTLCFPFGKPPAYAPNYPFYYDDPTHFEDKYPDAYRVAVGGNEVEAKLRHTYSAPYTPFDVESDLSKIVDSYIEDVFYTPDLPVVKYTYKVEDFKNDKSDFNVYAAFEIANIDGNARVYFPEMLSVYTTESVYRVGTCVDIGKIFDIYVFGGTSSSDLPKWKFYANLGLNDDDEISGIMSAPEAETMTFEEFALAGRGENSNVSKIDWYNAVITQLVEKRGQSKCPAVTLEGHADTLEKNLMRWYEYELTFAPGERVVNSVTAPIYPTVMDSFDPPKYCYTYLLSPAKTWDEFGRLDIKINTPYFLLDSSTFASGFEKTDDGFELTLDGLPNGELTFTLCASEHPKEESSSIFMTFIYVILFILTFLGALLPQIGAASGIILAILLIRPILDIAGSIITLIVLGIRGAIKKKRDGEHVSLSTPCETSDVPCETQYAQDETSCAQGETQYAQGETPESVDGEPVSEDDENK